MTKETFHSARLKIFRRKSSDWAWKLIAPNGRVIAHNHGLNRKPSRWKIVGQLRNSLSKLTNGDSQ